MGWLGWKAATPLCDYIFAVKARWGGKEEGKELCLTLFSTVLPLRGSCYFIPWGISWRRRLEPASWATFRLE